MKFRPSLDELLRLGVITQKQYSDIKGKNAAHVVDHELRKHALERHAASRRGGKA